LATTGAGIGLAAVLVFAAARALPAAPKMGAAKQAYTASGVFVEGCSCSAPCPCELVDVKKGCEGVGAMTLTSGSYMGTDLAGTKIAYATGPGEWVRLYVDPKNPSQAKAAEAFAKAVYSAFGPIEAVKQAPIAISGKGGRYTLTVDGGKIMKLTTEPVLGGNKRTPIMISNTQDPLHPDVMQGKTVSGSYKDEKHSFELKGSNSYFTDRMKSSGKI
jgi:hypothetical protein